MCRTASSVLERITTSLELFGVVDIVVWFMGVMIGRCVFALGLQSTSCSDNNPSSLSSAQPIKQNLMVIVPARDDVEVHDITGFNQQPASTAGTSDRGGFTKSLLPLLRRVLEHLGTCSKDRGL